MQPKLSNRSTKVLASPLRKFLPAMLKTESKGIEVLKLNVGDPDIKPPTSFLESVKKYSQPNIGYAPSPGIIKHTQAWSRYFASVGLKVKAEQIIPTIGCAEAMLMSLLATTDPGDEVLVFEPLYTSYKGFAAMINIKLVPVTLKMENNFALPKANEITKKITPKTKAILLINPNNPTGTVFSKKELGTIVKLAIEHGLFILSDETYREIVFDTKPTSLLQFPQAQENLIVLDSASKRFSLPGARIGALITKNQTIREALLRLAMVRLSAPTLEQYGLIPILEKPQAYTKKITAEYQRRRDLVIKGLNKIPGVTCLVPQGAFYLIAKLPIADAENFVKFMINDFSYQGQTVLVAPASEFYITPNTGKNQIRIAYVLNTTKLNRATTILAKGLAAYQNANK
ncbi:MAG: pyridoxal phosphate-dependent aminotransferase [Patescibacteria group bacterium]|jgi:aspartate aminotransferase|nr:pyridoxal phosphate-dependent aminotransferase [Patescibacteria group bacterium]